MMHETLWIVGAGVNTIVGKSIVDDDVDNLVASVINKLVRLLLMQNTRAQSPGNLSNIAPASGTQEMSTRLFAFKRTASHRAGAAGAAR
jgi:hypothetical protein